MKKCISSFVLAVAAAIVSAQGAIVNLTATKDAETHPANWGEGNLNYGASAVLNTGDIAGDSVMDFIAFVGFDNLPGDIVGATINSASLQLSIRYAQAPATNYSVQLLTQNWTEGTGNGVATGDGITNETYDGVNQWPGWPAGRAGALSLVVDGSNNVINFDTQTVPSIPQVPGDLTVAGYVTFDMKTAVEHWAAGNANDGLRVFRTTPFGQGGNWMNFYSRSQAGREPLLSIDYTPIPEPAGLAILVGGCLLMQYRRVR